MSPTRAQNSDKSTFVTLSGIHGVSLDLCPPIDTGVSKVMLEYPMYNPLWYTFMLTAKAVTLAENGLSSVNLPKASPSLIESHDAEIWTKLMNGLATSGGSSTVVVMEGKAAASTSSCDDPVLPCSVNCTGMPRANMDRNRRRESVFCSVCTRKASTPVTLFTPGTTVSGVGTIARPSHVAGVCSTSPPYTSTSSPPDAIVADTFVGLFSEARPVMKAAVTLPACTSASVITGLSGGSSPLRPGIDTFSAMSDTVTLSGFLPIPSTVRFVKASARTENVAFFEANTVDIIDPTADAPPAPQAAGCMVHEATTAMLSFARMVELTGRCADSCPTNAPKPPLPSLTTMFDTPREVVVTLRNERAGCRIVTCPVTLTRMPVWHDDETVVWLFSAIPSSRIRIDEMSEVTPPTSPGNACVTLKRRTTSLSHADCGGMARYPLAASTTASPCKRTSALRPLR
mmetsp:Transcript_4772/g.15428  ORF Transcript_4772/g.15428 Transcript_4772/m.15428 type:complete len:457 (+) Transcript_4772:562-1932(+)